MTDRQTQIIEIVNEKNKIEVNNLATILNVSSVTIRKDLDVLENKGFLVREHGFAVKCNDDNINYRLAIRYDVKMSIAKKAADMVNNGETIIIESGSSCVLLAIELAKSDKDVTIITNSAYVASNVVENNSGNTKVILLGGEFQKDSQVMVGPLVRLCAKEFHVDKMFVGTDGFNSNYGFTGSDLMRAESVKALSESAQNAYILTDSSKFNSLGVVMLLKFNEVRGVITDKEIPTSIKTILKDKNVDLIISDN